MAMSEYPEEIKVMGENVSFIRRLKGRKRILISIIIIALIISAFSVAYVLLIPQGRPECYNVDISMGPIGTADGVVVGIVSVMGYAKWNEIYLAIYEEKYPLSPYEPPENLSDGSIMTILSQNISYGGSNNWSPIVGPLSVEQFVLMGDENQRVIYHYSQYGFIKRGDYFSINYSLEDPQYNYNYLFVLGINSDPITGYCFTCIV